MDIIDIMLARAMTPQGQTETYVAKANAAAAKAAKAEQDAAAAIATVTAAAEEIAAAQEAAADLLATAQDTLETAQSAQINMPEVYSTTGQNTDGYMTQKAVTDALATKANSTELNNYVTINTYNTGIAAKADKTYVDSQIAAIPASSSSATTINFSVDDAGHIIIIDENGHPIASNITEESLLEALLNTNNYTISDAIGLSIDYAGRSFERIQGATNLTMGNDFDQFPMYGGRVRCNVADDGTINAFYGEQGYKDDGTNGQVMIYQPKFYYKRIIGTTESLTRGQIIRSESLILSATEQSGFKLAPIFGDNLDYVLLPAYEGAIIDNKLTSIAGQKPATEMTVAQAEAYANNRGNGWHIMNMAAVSANQMLEMVEFGTMNGQSAVEQGITYNPSGSNTCYFITGSTSSLGNGTGHANSTEVEINGVRSITNTDGQRAISYRGMENPWGNLWNMIGDVNVKGTGYDNGGTVFICKDTSYTPGTVGSNYEDIGFNLPSVYGWVNAMGYGDEKYDWVYMPIQCSNNANSLLPVGDGMWTVANLNNTMIMVYGGAYGFKEECGPFYYGADRKHEYSARTNYNARLIFIPTKNATYTANISKWTNYIGG